MKITDIYEAYYDVGNLSDEQLSKNYPMKDSSAFTQVRGRVFYIAIKRIRQNDLAKGVNAKGLKSLHVYGAGEYKSMKCYLGSNNASGYAIKDGSELVSVFSTIGGSASAIMASAISNGASHLDCFAERKSDGSFAGPLYSLYSRSGFKIDESRNEGTPGEPYAIVKGVSSFVDDAGKVHEDDPRVVIFMRR